MDTSGAHPIDTIDDLRRHLQWAIELEHATIPPYLCALYSLDPARNPEAAQVVGTVLAEEMIHLALAANLLNAVGGAPRLDTPDLLPPYPHPLPHGDRSVHVPWRRSARKPSSCSCASSSPRRRTRRRRPTSTGRSASSTPPSRPACAPCATSWARSGCSAAIRPGRSASSTCGAGVA